LLNFAILVHRSYFFFLEFSQAQSLLNKLDNTEMQNLLDVIGYFIRFRLNALKNTTVWMLAIVEGIIGERTSTASEFTNFGPYALREAANALWYVPVTRATFYGAGLLVD
jgi:hypothetical protein